MKTLWKGETPLHPSFAAVNRSLRQDWFLLAYELRLQRAHAKALAAANLLSAAEHTDIARALDAIEAEFAGTPCADADVEDIHTWIEVQLVERIGAAGRKIHAGRSRNDQVATLLALYVIDSGRGLKDALAALVLSLCDRAKRWSDLPMPMQTHCQFAAPGNVGFWALRFAAAFERAHALLRLLGEHWREGCPLGSGAVAGSSLPIDRGLQAAELGFGFPSVNALYSTCTRDECLELLALLGRIALHLQSFATDVIGFSQTSLGWTVYPAAFATGSSMMPNKINPDAMELLRGECTAVEAAHGHAVLLMKGLPSGYNRDLQCIKPILREAVEKTGWAVELADAFVAALEFDRAALEKSMRLGAIDATLRMEAMIREGTPMRDAHHAVAEAVRRETAKGGAAPSLDAGAYQTIGGASPAETRRAAEEIVARLGR